MLVRVWKTTFDLNQKSKLVDYANNVSLPVLSTRPGNLGVMFYTENDHWVTLTLWKDHSAIDRLNTDQEYARIVEGILELGVLGDSQETTIYNYEGGKVQ